MRHTKEYMIRKTDVHIDRKRKIIENVWGMSEEMKEKCILLKQPHRLSKSKVHCSCPMCSAKTKRDGWKHKDRIKLEKGWGEALF